MDTAGARKRAGRIAGALRRARTGSAMRDLAGELGAAVRARPRPPYGVRAVCRALCEEMTVHRDGRPVELRFERFPDEIEVTGLWVELPDFDLIIVEERAEAVQQLVILGHELWHLHAGHRHGGGPAAARALTGAPNWQDALAVAARNGSRQHDEAEAEAFGHRLAAAFRPYLTGRGGRLDLDPLERSMGYRGPRGTDR
ncbi:toxin-antitoxin system, toxin component family protein [Streptomyces sp. NPDC090106]|uniref:toxin-antitoxin system, toxin component family protein n=1 Tax=Streptomyces sp. NPDC090106 TaxID=3365946 RepID=UPI0038050D7B